MARIVRKINFIPLIPKPLRVAAYARVSSGKDAMLHSLAAQVDYYSTYIRHHAGWEYVGVYADEAKTGTKDNRESFQRLLADCRSGKIDRVLTKSVSRFARNTVTLLEKVRELKGLGVSVYFEEQNIDTATTDGELMLTILASFAEEESLSASENQKWRVRRNFEDGKPWNGTMLGYRYESGKLVIVPEEAEQVKSIYAAYLSGKGYYLITKELNSAGELPKSGLLWRASVIAKMLKNYNYTGNLLLQKTYRDNYITKRSKKNHGELPRYLAEDTHEAIIDTDTFNAVQAEMKSRTERFTHEEKMGITYPLTGMIHCGHCGKNFNRKTVRGQKIWRCSTYNKMGKKYCRMKQIPEDILHKVISDTVGDIDDVDYITANEDNLLTFHTKDGSVIEAEWCDRSRAESWTDEMRCAVGQQTRERNEKNVKG